jgi:hypothetical protein
MRLVFCLLLAMVASAFAGKSEAFFPLEKGTFWVYQGDVSWLEQNPSTKENEIKTQTLTWKMEVVDTASRGKYFGALIKGMPNDLAWYNSGKPRGDYLILSERGRKYFLFREDDALAAFTTLRKNGPEMKKLTDNGEILLDLPLTQGKTFGGDKESMARRRYCWVIEGNSAWDGDPEIKGIPTGLKTLVNLTYRSNPEHTFFEFAPGLGIVSYTYGHHGTTAECDMRLVEFGKADRKASQQEKTQ